MAALNEEISLRLAQELVADPEKLVRAVERDRGLMETFLDFVRGLKNRIAIRLSGSERAMLDEAERTLVNLLRGEAGSVAGEKYSFVRATDAEQIARAQELEAQGENAKTIWSETHLTRDGGGAWVREINDRGAKPRPDGDARGETGGRLADYLEHPELYEAVPGIADINVKLGMLPESEKGKYSSKKRMLHFAEDCALPGFVDSKNEEKTERNAGYLVVSHSGGGMLRQGTRKGIRRTPANRGMRAHRIVKSLDISEDVCHGLCP